MKILLVEDSRSLVRIMTGRLTSYGHVVIHAENGKEAVNTFQQASPDLVLMDIEMPLMNGFEATNRIRAIEANQQWAWTPIIFLTASEVVQDLVTAIEAGGDDFMSKSIPEPVLKAKMKAMSRIATLRHSLSEANVKLQALANFDGLTGLCNRRNMDLRVDEAWLDAQEADRPFAILMVDIDNFKKYNDTYGHQFGDHCLRFVAKAIEDVTFSANAEGLTKGAFAARYGGEEFAVIIPNASIDAFEACSSSIVNGIRQLKIPHKTNENWEIVTLSVGGAHIDHSNSIELQNLFRQADERLFSAKNRGRNRAELQD